MGSLSKLSARPGARIVRIQAKLQITKSALDTVTSSDLHFARMAAVLVASKETFVMTERWVSDGTFGNV